MSIYDTEDLMQNCASLLGTSSMFLSITEIGEEAIEAACKIVEIDDPGHYRAADKYSRKAGNSIKTRMDEILGIDDVLEVETEEGTPLRVAIDWTDNQDLLVTKADRFKHRQAVLKTLNCELAFAVSVTDQVKLVNNKQKLAFMYKALTLIMDRVDLAVKKGNKTGYLQINMKALMK